MTDKKPTRRRAAVQGALQCARLGLRVFPVWQPAASVGCVCPKGQECQNAGKHPIHSDWQTEATTNTSQIDEWSERYPNANYGILTTDLVVVDVDPRNGGDPKNLPDWLPRTTFVVKTGGGGWHFGFLPPAGERIRSGKLGPGLDVKGKGGFVVAPGSLHASGARYQWAGEPPAPDTVAGWPPGRAATGAPGPAPGPGDNGAATGQTPAPPGAGSLGALLGGAAAGTRDDAAARLAGYFLGKGIPGDLVFATLKPWLAALEQPPGDEWTEEDLKRVIASVERAEREKPSEESFNPSDPRYLKRVADELFSLRAKEEAKRQLIGESWDTPVSEGNLTYQLEHPEPVRWAIERLLVEGGNALLAAQYKTGKTTLTRNLARSFVDGVPFLRAFRCEPVPTDRTVAVWDFEMPRGQSQQWWRDLGVKNTDAIVPLHLKGRRGFLESEAGRDWAVQWLVEHSVWAWILDPFTRAYGGDENDNSAVAQFTDALDEIKDIAQVPVCVMVAHFGRAAGEPGKEHVRGATRLDDWSDARWLLTRRGDDRFFSAEGRDVGVPSTQLTYDFTTRELILLTGQQAQRVTQLEADILDYLERMGREYQGDALKKAITGRAIEQGVTGRVDRIRLARDQLIEKGAIVVVKGPQGERWHYLASHPAVSQMGLL